MATTTTTRCWTTPTMPATARSTGVACGLMVRSGSGLWMRVDAQSAVAWGLVRLEGVQCRVRIQPERASGVHPVLRCSLGVQCRVQCRVRRGSHRPNLLSNGNSARAAL